MKKVYRSIVLLLCVGTCFSFGGREVLADTMLPAFMHGGEMHLTKEGSPYYTSDRGLFVYDGGVVTIDPGVTVLFPNDAGFYIFENGVLNIGNDSSSEKVTMDVDKVHPDPKDKIRFYKSNWVGLLYRGAKINIRNLDLRNSFSGLRLNNCISSIFNLDLRGKREDTSFYSEGVQVVGGTFDMSSSSISRIRFGAGVSIEGGVIGSMTNNVLYKNIIGLRINNSSPFTISNNTFSVNTNDVKNISSTTVDVAGNYWGEPDGPLEDAFIGPVEAYPWLNYSPQNFYPCCSSVLFIPGFEGTRLFSGSNQLWEPNRNADVDKLAMDSNGKSIDKNIKVGEIIKRTNIGFGIFDQNMYAGIAKSFDDLMMGGDIQSWKDFPYDWRLNLGIDDPILKTIATMADLSYTGKVSIVGHSNGGLVAKEIASFLGTTTRNRILDSLILVATPQIGAPSALGALLHGDEQSIAGGFVLNKATARAFGKNVPVAYNLLPSVSLSGSFVRFSSSTDFVSNLRTSYGDNINSFSGLLSFLKGNIDGRSDPSKSETDKPAVLNSVLLTISTALHQNILDNLSIKNPIFQIGGTNFPTTEAIEYFSKKFCLGFLCIPTYSLTHKTIKTNEGDGTVPLRSALFASSTSYVFDLGSYNTENKTNISHSNILEAEPIQKLIASILTRKYIPPVSFVSQSEYKSITPPSTPLYRYRVNSSVTLDAYDSLKRHTGKSLNQNISSDLVFVQSDIPNSVYEEGDQDVSVMVQGNVWPITLDLKAKEEGNVSFDMTTIDSSGQEQTNISFVNVPLPAEGSAEITVDPHVSSSSVVMNIDTDSDGRVDKTIEAPLEGYFPPLTVEAPRENMFTKTVISEGVRQGAHRRTPEYLESIRKLFASFAK